MEKEIDTLVLEYLTFRQYKKTCKIFNQESGLSSQVKESIKQEKIAEFLELLQAGNRLEFFKLWDAATHKDKNMKLEFLFHVYFAILPIHDYVICEKESIRNSMNHFKKYLEKGSLLCKDDEYLCYYALPYIPEESLKHHPSFKDIFTKEWIQDLHDRTMAYLNNRFSESSSNFPRLIYMYQDKNASQDFQNQNKQVSELKRQIQNYKNNETEIERKHRQLQIDYQGLLSISSDLVQSLAQSISGQKVSPSYLSTICKRLALLKSSKGGHKTETLQTMIDSRLIVDSHKSARNPLPAISAIPTIPVVEMTKTSQNSNTLNYQNIKKDLMDYSQGADVKVFKLLLALRHHLPNNNLIARKNILHEYVSNDIFNIVSGKNIIIDILTNGSIQIKEHAGKLINAMVSDHIGRAYLISNKFNTLIKLLNIAQSETADTHFRQYIFGVLQKLSLRRDCQSLMINNGWIDYLFNLLNDLESLSEYSIEYASALLMNLCLRTQAKKECAKDPSKTLKVLLELIEHDNVQVKTYVNGILFSILTESSIKEEARAIGLEDQFLCLKDESDEQFNRQIDFVLEALSNDVEEMSAISEDGEEEDDLEEEDDTQTIIDEDDFEDSGIQEFDSESFLQDYSAIPHAHAPVAADPLPKISFNQARSIREKDHRDQEEEHESNDVKSLNGDMNIKPPINPVSDVIKKGKIPANNDDYVTVSERLNCPTCGSDFVEQIEHVPVQVVDPSQLIFESIFGRFMEMSQNRSGPGMSRGTNPTNPLDPSVEMGNQIPPQLAMLLQILTRGIPVESLPIHGRSGDYIIGDRGLDNIITQLMEQYASQNMPPPASSEAIQNLERIKIKVEELGDSTSCSICQDDFKQDEDAITLPCKHFFHPNCIIEWLKVNGAFTLIISGTCPVCRYSLLSFDNNS